MTMIPFIADHPARVLVVDDERVNRDLVGIILTCEGFEVDFAASGEEALASVALRLPDVVLLDIMMPGIDGYQVAAELKGSLATSSVPIIMISALADPRARARASSTGAEGFLSKPMDRDMLLSRVKNLLRTTYDGYHEGAPGLAPLGAKVA